MWGRHCPHEGCGGKTKVVTDGSLIVKIVVAQVLAVVETCLFFGSPGFGEK